MAIVRPRLARDRKGLIGRDHERTVRSLDPWGNGSLALLPVTATLLSVCGFAVR